MPHNKGRLTPAERKVIAGSIGRCSACGKLGQYSIHEHLIGTGRIYMQHVQALATCICGQNHFHAFCRI